MSARLPIAAHAAGGVAWAGLLALGLAAACTSGGGGGTGGVLGPEPGYEPPGTTNDPGGPNGTKTGPEPTGTGGYEPGGNNPYDPPPSGGSCSLCGKTYTCSITIDGTSDSFPVTLGPASNGACSALGGVSAGSFSCDGTATGEDGGTISWASDGHGGFTVGENGTNLDCTLGSSATSSGSSSSGSSGGNSSGGNSSGPVGEPGVPVEFDAG